MIVDADDAIVDFNCSPSKRAMDCNILACRNPWYFSCFAIDEKRQTLMLKISIVDSGAERRLVLEGALAPPSLMALRSAWLKASAGRQGRRIVLVFRNVTDISAEGEAALWELMNRGVRISSGELPTRSILQQLIRKNRPRE
jgi:hypothetical protein